MKAAEAGGSGGKIERQRNSQMVMIYNEFNDLQHNIFEKRLTSENLIV